MRARTLSTVLILVAVSSAAPAGAAASATLESFGLEGHVVTSLGVFGSLYAGTDGDGVFKRDPAAPEAGWAPLGLKGKIVRAVYPHAAGALGFTTTVGLQGNPLYPDSALIYCSEMDQPPWVVADSGMTRTDVTAVWSLDGFPSAAICGETFAGTMGSAGGVWRRAFGATRWEFVLDIGLGVCNVVRADPASGYVWAGGENALLAPWLARSTDLGETWQVVYPFLGGDNACNSIAVHPDDPDIAYAGMEGPVIKTGDGGLTWAYTALDESQAYIYGVALDSGLPSHILAGGTVTNPNNWALWESYDGGAAWHEIPPPAPGTSGISSIVSDPVRPGTFYLATFGDGVWRYRNVVTGVHGPPLAAGVVLAPNFPNPFNPFTTVRYEIPPSLDGSRVHLAIYTVRGSLVRVLTEDVRGSGPHETAWDGTDTSGRPVASGVYQCRLRVGRYQQSRRITLLR